MTINAALSDLRKLLPPDLAREPFWNMNEVHDDTLSFGQKVADGVARNMGSWRFIIIQSILLAAWVTANIVLAAHEVTLYGFNLRAWDAAPFILLNLALSFQAAYAAPIIMMSQNRQADKDRLAAEHDYHVNIRAEARVRAVLEHLKAQDDVILEILRQLEAVHGMKPGANQLKAEKHLQEVIWTEERVVKATIAAAEKEAGLEVDPSAAPGGDASAPS